MRGPFEASSALTIDYYNLEAGSGLSPSRSSNSPPRSAEVNLDSISELERPQ